MSFLIPLALALCLTIVFPILAHALRKGQARALAFPAAHLVPERKSSAKQRHRIEDHLLLLLRVLILICLALLAATPFVQCSRLSLSRTDGASVAAALVIDDSASMRARTSGDRTRLESAISGAKQLLDAARPGDSFSIILAGHPARILTPSTTELGSVREALEAIKPSDRRTDLASALTLARDLQADLPQKDRPVVLLSDLAHSGDLDLSGVLLPEASLTAPLSNCAALSAVRSANGVQVEVACTGKEALSGRQAELVDASGGAVAQPVPAQDGMIRIALTSDARGNANTAWMARLTPPEDKARDHIQADDECVVLKSAATHSVAVRADQGKAGMKTGAGTVVQAAIEALDSGARVHTLTLLPDRSPGLDEFGALFIDDPSGFTPEVGDAIGAWVRQGGVAVSLLGPAVESTPLGSTFAPFLDAAVKWETTVSPGADPEKAGSLGPLTTTWANLGTRRRVTFSPEESSEVKARWSDGQPMVLEKTLGRGLLLSVGLPASVDVSDLALRPAFLELLDYAVSQSAIRRGAQATPVGDRWPVDESAIVRDPLGTMVEKKSLADSATAAEAYVEPALAGRYTITQPDEDPGAPPHIRVAMRDTTEHVAQPNDSLRAGGSERQQAALTKVGISREIALLALILSTLELSYRAFRRARHAGPLPEAVS